MPGVRYGVPLRTNVERLSLLSSAGVHAERSAAERSPFSTYRREGNGDSRHEPASWAHIEFVRKSALLRADRQTRAITNLLADAVLEMPERSHPALDLDGLDTVLRNPDAMPAGIRVRQFGGRQYGYLAPGMAEEIRVTTDADLFDEHADSFELWSPGSPAFPDLDGC
jgi:hypothetical protein